jgi:putative spermidine/putrescine transport system ATP-binding protein
MPHLRLQNLEKRYDATVAVRGLTLSLEKGRLLSLLGPSGCGKTTTLRMIAGFVAPTAGTISIGDARIDRDPPERRNIGMVFQNYALFPHMTAARNVEFGLRMRAVARAERDARVAEALEMVGLAALAARYPAQLSGGQQQRVALARALVIRPDVLLLDEPLSNLDAALRAEMRAEIRALQRRTGITTVLVTHDQAEALAMSDRVAVMSEGELVEEGTPEELASRPRRLFTAGFLSARTALPGRVERDGGAARFVAEGGIALDLPADAPVGADHAVLRASRLRLLPAGADPGGAAFAVPVSVERASFLGDTIEIEVAAGGRRIAVVRPAGEDLPPVGAAALLAAPADAVTFIAEPHTHGGPRT